MQPRMTQVPPIRDSSASATLAPAIAAIRLARTPPEPPPMTKRSKSYWVMTVHSREAERRLRAGKDFGVAGPRDQQGRGQADEQAMLDNARHRRNRRRQLGRVLDHAEGQ